MATKTHPYIILYKAEGKGEGEVAFFGAKHWDCRNRADLIESVTPCHDSEVVGLYRDSNPLHLTILAVMSEDYTTAPQQGYGKPLGKVRLTNRSGGILHCLVFVACMQYFCCQNNRKIARRLLFLKLQSSNK